MSPSTSASSAAPPPSPVRSAAGSRTNARLTVSVGVAPSKLVAKIASDHDKPDGLTVVKPADVEAFLAPLPVRRLHGVGPAGREGAARTGVTTVAELRQLSLDRLIERFGHWGRTLHAFARGEDSREVHTHQIRKSLSTEHTFAEDIRDPAEIDRVLEGMADEVAAGLAQSESSPPPPSPSRRGIPTSPRSRDRTPFRFPPRPSTPSWLAHASWSVLPRRLTVRFGSSASAPPTWSPAASSSSRSSAASAPRTASDREADRPPRPPLAGRSHDRGRSCLRHSCRDSPRRAAEAPSPPRGSDSAFGRPATRSPDRCLDLGAGTLPICARCAGLYAGAFAV